MGLTYTKLRVTQGSRQFQQQTNSVPIGAESRLVSAAPPWYEEFFSVIGDYISGFRTAYPLEASVSFRRPLKWLTHFSEDNLQNVNFGVGYQKKQNADGSPTIFSEDVGPDGRPLFLLTRNNVNKWEIEVWSMEHIANLLNMSSDGIVREIGGCFEACNDPVAHMFNIHDLEHVEDENHAEAIQGIIMRMEEADIDAAMRRTYMLLMQFDILFLHRKFMYRIGDDEYQQPDEVYAEVRMLQHMSKFHEISPLISLEYLLDKCEFGWRAPLWRQVLGDVCYLIVTLHDEEDVVGAAEPQPSNAALATSDNEENHKSAFNVVVLSENEDTKSGNHKLTNSSRGKVGPNHRDSGVARKRPRRQHQRISITCNVTGVFQNGLLKASEAAADAAALAAEAAKPKKPDTLTVQPAAPHGHNTTDESADDGDSDSRSARSVLSNLSSTGEGGRQRGTSRTQRRKRKHRAARAEDEQPQQLRPVVVNVHDRESFAQKSENYASISSLLRAKSPIFAKQLHSAQARYERLRTEERRRAMHDKSGRSLDDMVDKNQQYLQKKDGRIFARPDGSSPEQQVSLSPINGAKPAARRKGASDGGGGDDGTVTGGEQQQPAQIIDEPMSSSDEDDRDLEDTKGTADMFVAELPASYWQIQKLCRYIKGGNETATLIALVAINDFNLSDDVTWLALRDSNCLEVLINILDVDGNTDCKVAALRTLKEICKNLSVARVVLQCEGLSSFINILDDPCLKLKALAAECLAYVARIRKARYYIRRDGGISALVGLMDVEMLANGSTIMALGGGIAAAAGGGRSNAGQPSNIFNTAAASRPTLGGAAATGPQNSGAGNTAAGTENAPPNAANAEQQNAAAATPAGGTGTDAVAGAAGENAAAAGGASGQAAAGSRSTYATQHRHHNDMNSDVVEVARGGAFAIWSCVRSMRNKIAVREAGGIPLLASLLKIDDDEVLVPVIGTLQECASEAIYRTAIRTEGIIIDLVRHLHRSQNPDIQMNCASAIFKCGDDSQIRSMVRQHGGLRPLKDLLENVKNHDNKPLMVALTGAVWKCAAEPENVTIFRDLGCVALLVSLGSSQPEEVLINTMGALAEMSRDPGSRVAIRKFNGLQSMIEMLSNTNQQLLVNVTRAVGLCAQDADSLAVIERMDGVRLLWSLLKNTNKDVKANAAWALCPCIENNKDAGDLVRSFVGGLELVVSLLRSDNDNVLAATCACVASIAKDEENLAVITDQGVVQLLSRLVSHKDDVLRAQLSMAIARCCKWGDNRRSFGDNNAVAPLVGYLKRPNVDADVKLQATKALFELSKDPGNCCVIHQNATVRYLLTFLAEDNEQLQSAAAGCLRHMRYLALANLAEFYHVTAKTE